jgi:hypothetical protein
MLAGVGILAVASEPVEAHSGTTGNYVSSVTSIVPPISGLTVTVIGRDDQVLLTNGTGKDVLVAGYQDEPYLRFLAEGVYANDRSPAYYLNNERFGAAQIPPTADPTAEPEWVKVAAGHSFAWHDHRIHWMSRSVPPSVQGNEGKRQVVFEWTVPLHIDGPVLVHGRLEWVPSVDAATWLGMGGIMLILALGAGVRSLKSLERSLRAAALIAVGAAALATTQAALLLSGFGARTTSLLEPLTFVLAAATTLVAFRAWREPLRVNGGVLSGAVAALSVVAGGLHFGLLTDAALDSPGDLVYPIVVTCELLLGLGAAALSALAVRNDSLVAPAPGGLEA